MPDIRKTSSSQEENVYLYMQMMKSTIHRNVKVRTVVLGSSKFSDYAISISFLKRNFKEFFVKRFSYKVSSFLSE
jgi:hypothetical protein